MRLVAVDHAQHPLVLVMRRYVNLKRLDLDAWRRPGWADRAACRGLDANLFHPERGENTAHAKKVCAACPVRDECLAYALTHYEKHGIWGGLSERERQPLRRDLVAAGRIDPYALIVNRYESNCGTPAGYDGHRRRHEAPCDSCREAHAAHEAERRAGPARYRDTA